MRLAFHSLLMTKTQPVTETPTVSPIMTNRELQTMKRAAVTAWAIIHLMMWTTPTIRSCHQLAAVITCTV